MDKVIFIPTSFGMPEQDDIYEVLKRVKNQDQNFIVRDIVWLREGKWVSMSGKPVPEEDVRAWQLKEPLSWGRIGGNHEKEGYDGNDADGGVREDEAGFI